VGYFTGIKGMKMKLIPPITAEVNVSSSFTAQVCHTDVVLRTERLLAVSSYTYVARPRRQNVCCKNMQW
jgi:hypothetical protein